jgi:hypothetical protein
MFKVVHGSRLYGTHTDDSDYDYVQVFAPPIEELLQGFSPKNKQVIKNGIDTRYIPLQNLIRGFLQGEMISVEVVYAYLQQPVTLEDAIKHDFFERLVAESRCNKKLLGFIKAVPEGKHTERAKQLASYIAEGKQITFPIEPINENLTLVEPKSTKWIGEYLAKYYGALC